MAETEKFKVLVDLIYSGGKADPGDVIDLANSPETQNLVSSKVLEQIVAPVPVDKNATVRRHRS